MTAALRFIIVFEALLLVGLPLAARAFGRLPGLGLGFARLLAWLVLAWSTWFVSSLGVPYSTLLIVIGAVALIAVAAWLHRRHGLALDPFTRRLFLWSEGIFLVAFALAVLIGGYVPDVWQTEHPLDMALVNANVTGDAMPPHDPWFAGEHLNYYYLGQNMVGVVLRLIDVEPTKGYNLALAAVFALIISTAFTVAATLAEAARRHGMAIRRPLAAGAWCVVLLCFMGNLRAGWSGWHDGKPLGQFNWFGPTRIIPNAINEFPFATWTVGDLHAHYIAVPLVLMAIAAAAQVALNGPPGLVSWETFAAALTIGWLYGAHTWSWPVAAGLAIAAAVGVSRARARGALWAGVTVVGGILLVLPFLLTVKANTRGVGFTTAEMREPTAAFLTHHLLTDGTFLWLLLAPLAALLWKWRDRWRLLLPIAAVASIMLPLLAGPHLVGAALLAGLVAATFIPALDPARPQAERLVWLIAAGGFGCLFAAEVGLVEDEFFGGPYVRLNTIFKFAYHAWLLLAVFGALALAAGRQWLPRGPRIAWLAVAIGLIGVGLGYVVPATYTKRQAFKVGPHLEGRTWLARLYPGDVDAIDWIRAHVPEDDVIVEAVGEEYSPYGYGRMSTYTGRATVIGWPFHESEYNHPPATREPDVRTLYTTKEAAVADQIIARYRIRYAVVGPLERNTYGTPRALLGRGREVFAARGTKVYALRGDDGPDQ